MKELDDLSKTKENFASRVKFAKKMETATAVSSVATSCVTVKMLCKTERRTLTFFFQMKGDFVDIREVEDNDAIVAKGISDSFYAPSHWFLAGEKREKQETRSFYCTHFHSSPSKGKRRIAHKPNSKPKLDAVLDPKEEDDENKEEGSDGGERKGILTEEELWARLDELEKLEALQDEQDR